MTFRLEYKSRIDEITIEEARQFSSFSTLIDEGVYEYQFNNSSVIDLIYEVLEDSDSFYNMDNKEKNLLFMIGYKTKPIDIYLSSDPDRSCNNSRLSSSNTVWLIKWIIDK